MGRTYREIHCRKYSYTERKTHPYKTYLFNLKPYNNIYIYLHIYLYVFAYSKIYLLIYNAYVPHIQVRTNPYNLLSTILDIKSVDFLQFQRDFVPQAKWE